MASPAASRLDGTLVALADPARRRVIDLLSKHPRRASDLAAALSMPRPAMSRHLKMLRKAGLVTQSVPDEGDARVRPYSLERRRLGELRDWLDEVESFWSDQLASFKAHAERRAKAGR